MVHVKCKLLPHTHVGLSYIASVSGLAWSGLAVIKWDLIIAYMRTDINTHNIGTTTTREQLLQHKNNNIISGQETRAGQPAKPGQSRAE